MGKKICLSLALVGCLFADDALELESTVITASGFSQALQDAPATINVIEAKDLEKKPVRDIAEAISEIPGVDLHASKGKTGTYNITMRGLTGYTLVLVDGRRQGVSGDIGPNGFGEVNSALLPPLSAIERIEVIKGPMSTLYGSEALGGVINIITKKVSKEWGTSVNFDTLIHENQDWGNQYGVGIYSRGPVIDEKLGVDLRAKFSHRDQSYVEFTNGGGERIPGDQAQSPTKAQFYNFGTKIRYLFDEANTFTWDFDYARNWYNNRNGELGTLTTTGNNGVLSGGYTKEMNVDRFIASVQHDGQYDGFNITTGAQYNVVTNDGREVVGQNTHPRIGQNRNIKAQDFILDTKAMLALGEMNTLSFGADYRLETIKDKIASPTYFDSYIVGVYAEDEMSILENLHFTLGARYNHHQNFGNNISPRAYLVFNPNDELTIKGGVSTGFRAPNPNRLIAGPYNYSGQGRNPTYGNPDLKEETSVNYELGFGYENDFFNTAVTGFYTIFDDKISTQSITCPAGVTGNCSRATNLGKVEYKGVEVGGGLRPITNLSLDLSYTFLDSEIKESATASSIGRAEANTLKHHIITKASYNIDRFSPWVKGEWQLGRYMGPTATPLNGSRYYKDIFLASLGVAYNINKDWNVNLSVENLFDKDFTDSWVNTGTSWSNRYNRIEEGRRYYLSINGNF